MRGEVSAGVSPAAVPISGERVREGAFAVAQTAGQGGARLASSERRAQWVSVCGAAHGRSAATQRNVPLHVLALGGVCTEHDGGELTFHFTSAALPRCVLGAGNEFR